MTRSATGTAKIAMVGAGQVDVTLACMIRDTGQTHRPYDRNAANVRAEGSTCSTDYSSCPRAPSLAPSDAAW